MHLDVISRGQKRHSIFDLQQKAQDAQNVEIPVKFLTLILQQSTFFGFYQMYKNTMNENAQKKLLKPVIKSGVSYDNYYDELRKKYFEFESTNKKHGMPTLDVHRNVDLNMVIHEFKIAKELRTQAWKAKSSRLHNENLKKPYGSMVATTQASSMITEEASKKILTKHMLDENLGYNTNYAVKFKDFLKKNQSTINDTKFNMTPRTKFRFNQFTPRQMESNHKVLNS